MSGSENLDGVDDLELAICLAEPAHVAGILSIQNRDEYRDCIERWTEQQLLTALTDPAIEVAVALQRENSVAGFYLLCDLRGQDRSVNLLRIAVANPGAGVGGRLLRWAQRRAFLEHGAHRLWLDVFTTNTRAEAIYRKHGWIEEGVLRDAKFRNGRYQSQRILSMLDNEWRERYA